MRTRHRPLQPSVIACAALAASMLPAGAQAQATSGSGQTVTITGSNIKRLDAEGPAPVQTVTREEIERSTAATVGDFVRSLTVNSAASFNESAVNNQSGAAGISLRGLGQKSTLVLINGRRFANHAIAQGTDTFVDINSIPKSAIERIEVLKDGASAIYGSDAIAGVVNFILRRDYQGLAAGLTAGKSTERGLGEQSFNLSWGAGDGSKFNVLAVLDYFHRDRLLVSERDTVGDGDFRSRPGGGLPWLSSSGGTWVLTPAVAGANRAPLVPCQGPSTPIPGNLFPFTTGTVCGFTTTPYITYLPESDRLGLMTRGTLALGSSLSLFGELSLANNRSQWINQPQQMTNLTTVLNPATGVPTTFNATIPASNPSNPFGVPRPLRYTFFDVGAREIELETNAWRALGGVQGALGAWDFEAAAGFSQSRIEEVTNNQVDAFRLSAAITNATYDFRAPTPAMSALLRISTTREADSKLAFADAKASTTFGKLAGGPIGFAAGVDFRREEMEDVPDPQLVGGAILGTGASRVEGSRTVGAAFAEFSLPVLKSLELQLAARADHYSDFGSAVTPKVAAKWTVLPEVLLRASYNRGFRAPTLAENAQSTSTGFINVTDPTRANATTLVSGVTVGNPNLEAEKSNAYNIGIVLEPGRGLSLALDLFHIEQKNLVALNGFQYIVTNEALFPGKVVRDGAGVIQSVTDAYTNISKVEVEGADFDIRYRFAPVAGSRVTLRSTTSYIHSWQQPAAQGQPLSEFAGVNNGPAGALPRMKTKLGFDVDHGPVALSWSTNYTSRYRNGSATSRAVAPTIRAHTTHDLYLGWNPVKNLRLSLAVTNLDDRQPPWDPTQALGFSVNQFDMRGRYVRGGIEYRFW